MKKWTTIILSVMLIITSAITFYVKEANTVDIASLDSPRKNIGGTTSIYFSLGTTFTDKNAYNRDTPYQLNGTGFIYDNKQNIIGYVSYIADTAGDYDILLDAYGNEEAYTKRTATIGEDEYLTYYVLYESAEESEIDDSINIKLFNETYRYILDLYIFNTDDADEAYDVLQRMKFNFAAADNSTTESEE